MPAPPQTPKRAFIFMGVSGCGKTTLGSRFAEVVGGEFLDGDDFHPPANVEKMRQAIPLDDSDRAGWIDSLRDAISDSEAELVCVACSALRRKHRDVLRGSHATVTFVFLHGSRELLGERLAGRSGHFMPPGLLDSQLADLEEPKDAERVDIADPPATIIVGLRDKFSL